MNVRSRVVRYVNSDRDLPVICTSVEKSNEIATLIVTAIIGSAKDKAISDRAESCIEQCIRISEETSRGLGMIYLVDLGAFDDLDEKVESALLRGKDGDAIIFVCSNDLIRERAVLNLALSEV